jgi:hypothetical protein
MPDPHDPLLCHRCGQILEPGVGSFYVVKIEATADPTGPVMTAAELQEDLRGQIESLVEQMRDQSERELIDQVYRRLTLHLCGTCYGTWIENPAP